MSALCAEISSCLLPRLVTVISRSASQMMKLSAYPHLSTRKLTHFQCHRRGYVVPAIVKVCVNVYIHDYSRCTVVVYRLQQTVGSWNV